MEKDGKKAAVVLGLAAVVGGAVIATRAKAAPHEGAAAKITITVLDSQGNPVPHNSPFDLIEGEGYQVVVMVTNQSTWGGSPVGATLEVVVQAATDYTTLIPVAASDVEFGAGEAKPIYLSMVVPLGTGGETGQIIAVVNDPAGIEVARTTEPVTIIAVEIIYGATVGITVIEGV